MRNEYRRQDFSALERGKFYSGPATEKVTSSVCSNQISKAITMNVQELIALALQLEPHERADMAAVLQASLPPPDPEIERLWAEEAQRRLAAFDAGRNPTYSMQEVFGKDEAADQ